MAPPSFGERAAGLEVKAAICSKSVVGIYDELEVLYEGTQDRSGMSLFLLRSPFTFDGISEDEWSDNLDNFTRFILLRSPHASTNGQYIDTSTSKSNFYLLDSPNRIPTLLSDSSIGSLHTRPTPCRDGRIYPHGVFIELVRHDGQSGEWEDKEGVMVLGSGDLVELDSAWLCIHSRDLISAWTCSLLSRLVWWRTGECVEEMMVPFPSPFPLGSWLLNTDTCFLVSHPPFSFSLSFSISLTHSPLDSAFDVSTTPSQETLEVKRDKWIRRWTSPLFQIQFDYSSSTFTK